MIAMLGALFLALAIVFSPASAAAGDCAWGLWINPTSDTAGWHLVNSVPAWYATKADCQSTATYREAGTSRQPGDVMCLPQGVEPVGKPGAYEYRSWRGGR
jgi:hypothetical protein